MLPPQTILTIGAAIGPILLVLYLMIGRKWKGSQAGPAGWLAAVLLALFIFGAHLPLLLIAFGRALLLSLFVLYIIWAALLLFHIINDAGAITQIGQELPKLAGDKPGQILLLAWIFGSFLQGASGFGVPAAVVAPLLVGLGFLPNVAVAAALLGHAWAVTFGSLGSSFFSLIAATGTDGALLAGPAAFFLGICCFACGGGCLWIAGGWQAIRQRLLSLLIIGGVMSLVQYGLATAGFWSIAAFGASLVGLILAAADLYWGLFSKGSRPKPFDPRPLLRAFFPYLILTIIILLGQTILKPYLSGVELNWYFPEAATRFGWVTPAGNGRSINLFGHAGALLLYACLLTFLWFKKHGPLQPQPMPYSGRAILRKTVQGSIKSTISIITLVAMAVTMQHAGMTQLLAEAISRHAGALFPLVSPFIGVLGAFMTGSNTNSNVVFGLLQQQTAVALNLSVPIILAGQTAGGAMGSLFAPAKVVVGCSTVAGSEEGAVLKTATFYGLLITLLLTPLVWLLS